MITITIEETDKDGRVLGRHVASAPIDKTDAKGVGTLLARSVGGLMYHGQTRAEVPLLLAAAAPAVGQPFLQGADPIVTQLVPGITLSPRPTDSGSWLARFAGLLLVLGGIPGVLGAILGPFARGARRR